MLYASVHELIIPMKFIFNANVLHINLILMMNVMRILNVTVPASTLCIYYLT